MALLRTDIEKALDELASYEEGMRFQGLAVILGKKRWPELIACQRKKDYGLDAYAPPSLPMERIGKGLAASITPTLRKFSADARAAKENFPDLGRLLFVTSSKVGNADRRKWEDAIQKDHGLELQIIEREEIITLMMMPENASLCASFLHLVIDAEPQIADLVDRTRRAAKSVLRISVAKTKGHPLIDLTAVRLEPNGAESSDVLSLEQIDQGLSQCGRIVLEGPAGRGKTTMLIQLSQRADTAVTPFMVELPAWTSSRKGILEYIAGMPAFQAEGLTAADLARVQQTEPFLFLLNGWNEIAESNFDQANVALRELERDFPSAGIIVATRMHHLTPPLRGALRLRLLRLRREQRAAFLTARLGAQGAELHARIDADSSLDELTLTPFILSEVTSLFEAGADIPSTIIGILDQVLRLLEQNHEHRNALQAAPVFGRQQEYLKSLATEMTVRGTVALPEEDALVAVFAVEQDLAQRGQTEPVGAPSVLATLTAHHVLERVEYPQTSFQFEHQQIQEYYAAIGLRAQLLQLTGNNDVPTSRFTADYVNDPAWAEPLCMIAESLSEQSGDHITDRRNSNAGAKLVTMALGVDFVFAGELARLCGTSAWNEVSAAVGERFRALYAIRNDNFQHYALAAMLATGAGDFSDIVVSVLSGQDEQIRLCTYRLWPDFQASSLGLNWRERVLGWSEEARADFVSELLHQRADGEIAAFAAEDCSSAVKKAAALGLMWTGSDKMLTSVLESMDAQTFEDVARENPDRIPPTLKSNAIGAMRKFIARTTDHRARLKTALDLIDSGEAGLNGVIKEAMARLPGGDIQNPGSHNIHRALGHLNKTDSRWVSEWVAAQIAERVLYEPEKWLPFVSDIPGGLVEKLLQRLETEDFKNRQFGGIAAVIAAGADANLAARVFTKLRGLRDKVDAELGQQHEFEWQMMNQLETVFRCLPDNVAAAGILSSITSGDPLDIRVAADLLSMVARFDVDPRRVTDDDLKARLRDYLKSSIDVVLAADDFNGKEKADLGSSIAQVGRPEEMADLLRLIRADIERMRRGRAARAVGDRGPLGNGGSVSYARWHIASVMNLDSAEADDVLISLILEPEYLLDAATTMAADYVPKPDHLFALTFRYDLIWAAREGRVPSASNNQRRRRFAAALNAEIKRLREQNQDEKTIVGLKELAKALAAIDGSGSAAVVLDVIAIPGKWGQYTCLEAAERLLRSGVILPTSTVLALVDSFLEGTERWMQDSDKYLLCRTLALCAFVDDPTVGIAQIREVLSKAQHRGLELGEIITALGESRSNASVDLLYELASDIRSFERYEHNFIDAFAALDTPRTRELLLAFVDPGIHGIAPTRGLLREDVLVARLTELARRRPEVARRLQELCECDLPDLNRFVLSKVMESLGTPEALAANLNLIDDARPSPIPRGVWDQLRSTFVEQRPSGENDNVFTLHAWPSNDLRVRLFRMASVDEKRRKSAFTLLGQIEVWRLELGRPWGEPRHPDLASGRSWPQ